jgi:hypothetical protein
MKYNGLTAENGGLTYNWRWQVKVGDLIRYWSIDGEPILGLVTKPPSFNKAYKRDAVNVYWFDDGSYTDEVVDAILSNDEEDSGIEVYSESR